MACLKCIQGEKCCEDTEVFEVRVFAPISLPDSVFAQKDEVVTLRGCIVSDLVAINHPHEVVVPATTETKSTKQKGEK